MKWLRNIYTTIRAWFIKPVKKRKRRVYKERLPGEWRLSKLLDRLPEYHKLIYQTKIKNILRGTDADAAYRLGPMLAPDRTLFRSDRLEKFFKKNDSFPSVFFLGWGLHFDEPESDKAFVPACLVFGVKTARPWNVEYHKGVCYSVYACWHWKRSKLTSWKQGYFFARKRQLTAAREQRRGFSTIRPKKGGYPFQIPVDQRSNDLVDSLEPFFVKGVEIPPQKRAEGLVCLALNFWAQRSSLWFAVTKRNGNRVTFAVREGQHKYFFKDRDKTVLTPTGQRKRIFHVVHEHERKTTRGFTTVKEHTRGLRIFDWDGYWCSIFSPDWHGLDAGTCPIAAVDPLDYEPEERKKLLLSSQVMEKMARITEGSSLR